jgi:hypothetical protein
MKNRMLGVTRHSRRYHYFYFNKDEEIDDYKITSPCGFQHFKSINDEDKDIEFLNENSLLLKHLRLCKMCKKFDKK